MNTAIKLLHYYIDFGVINVKLLMGYEISEVLTGNDIEI